VELSKDNAVAQELLTDKEPPQSFELIRTVMLRLDPDGDAPQIIFARLYRVRSPETAVPLSGDSSAEILASELQPAVGSHQ
jgi:hypothetical protein